MKIVYGPDLCGFYLGKSTLEELYRRGFKFIHLSDKKDYPEDMIEHADYYDLAIFDDKIIELDDLIDEKLIRTDPILIQLIEEHGGEIRGKYGMAKIIDIPDDANWIIQSDSETGHEWIAENHRTWR